MNKQGNAEATAKVTDPEQKISKPKAGAWNATTPSMNPIDILAIFIWSPLPWILLGWRTAIRMFKLLESIQNVYD